MLRRILHGGMALKLSAGIFFDTPNSWPACTLGESIETSVQHNLNTFEATFSVLRLISDDYSFVSL
jgi:hypothetical protein